MKRFADPLTPGYVIQLLIALLVALVLVVMMLVALPVQIKQVRAAGHAAADTTAAISPTVIAEIIGGGTDYDKAVNGIPMAVNYNGNLAAAYPASDTTEIVVEASHCDQNELPPPGFNVTRSFIEYDTSAITRSLTSARLVFTAYEPFVHDGTGQAVHDLMIHRGTWTAAAELTPTFVASTTFQAWQTSTLASINFGPINTYPYRAELEIDPSAVISGGTTRLLFRTSAESMVGPLPGTCPTDPEGIGSKFTAPLLEVTYAADNHSGDVYLPLITKS